jgi:hypothetical protein
MGFNSAFNGLNEHFRGLSQALLLNELCLPSDKCLGFHPKRNLAVKLLPT